MKVLLVNTYDLRGGAARATLRLLGGLQKSGVNALLMVQNKDSRDPHIIPIGGSITKAFNPFRPYLDFMIPLLRTRKRVLFSTSLIPDQAIGRILEIDPEIVHLNWIAGGFIRIESLAGISKPIVWTLHDMWAFTGGCHYANDCERFKEQCGQCPILHSFSDNDLSSRTFNRKADTYKKITNLTIITPSNWLAGSVKSSRLLSDRRVEVIPNGLDSEIFKPYNKQEIRYRLGLPAEKKLIIFGAIRGVSSEQKGFTHLIEALQKIERSDIELLVFGSSHSKKVESLKINTRFFGVIEKETTLAELYSAADVAVVPSFQEVFGQTATEAMACGTPVVAYAATGLLDIVIHKHTGYLAKPFDTEDLARGIQWVLEDPARTKQISVNSRSRILEKFDIQKVTSGIIELYKELAGTSQNQTIAT